MEIIYTYIVYKLHTCQKTSSRGIWNILHRYRDCICWRMVLRNSVACRIWAYHPRTHKTPNNLDLNFDRCSLTSPCSNRRPNYQEQPHIHVHEWDKPQQKSYWMFLFGRGSNRKCEKFSYVVSTRVLKWKWRILPCWIWKPEIKHAQTWKSQFGL